MSLLIIEKPAAVFDLSKIKCGDLFWGKHTSWREGKAGFVTAATETKLTVQYHPGIGNVTNHFFIPVSEVQRKEWEIRWSADMSEVFEFCPEAAGEQEEDGEDESGGIDL